MQTTRETSTTTAPAPPAEGVRAEWSLLVATARTSLSDETEARIRELAQQKLDWQLIEKAAKWHGITPLLYRNLDSLGVEVPGDVLDRLKTYFHENGRRNLYYTAELARILAAFEAGGVTCIPFKGPMLASSAHGNLALRQFGDLDVIVDRAQLPRAIEIAKAEGFAPAVKLTAAQERLIFAHDCEYVMLRARDGILLEIHWRFIQKTFPFPLDVATLADRLVSVPLAGVTVKSIPPEEMLLIICVHSCKHLWRRLRWISDASELVLAHPEMDWDFLLRRARELRCLKMLYLGLLVIDDLLGTRAPDAVQAQARKDSSLCSLAQHVRGLILGGVAVEIEGPRGHGFPGYFDRSLFYMRAMDRRRDRINYFARFLVTPTGEDWEGLQLPDVLFPLYYLYRPLRMTKWLARWVWRRATARIAASRNGERSRDS